MMGGKVIWAKDADGEVGKRPTLEPHLFEISAETYLSMQARLRHVAGVRR